MFVSKVALLLTILPFTIATTCNSANAQPYTGSGKNSNPGSTQAAIDATFETCSTACGSTSRCLVGCLSDACATYCDSKSSSSSGCQSKCISNPCPAFYGSGSDTPDPTALAACLKAKQAGECNIVGGSACTKMLRSTAAFECSDSQSCFEETTNGNLFCLNTSTGEYIDHLGGTGNVASGVYTSAGSSTAAAKADASSTAKSTRVSDAPSTPAGTSAAGAATSSGSAAMGQFRPDAVIGVMGLVLGLVL